MDLFDIRYPDSPGFKSSGPSEEAAHKVTGRAAILRAQVLERYRKVYPQGLTADEVASALNQSVLSIRPRVSELHRNGEITDTKTRRKNDSGMSATVWRFVPQPYPKAAA